MRLLLEGLWQYVADKEMGGEGSAVREIMSLCLRYTCVLLFLSVSQLMLRS